MNISQNIFKKVGEGEGGGDMLYPILRKELVWSWFYGDSGII